MTATTKLTTVPKIVAPILLSLVIAAYFTATQPIAPEMSVVSAVAVVGFAMPSYLALIHIGGKKAGLITIALLGLYALVIETLAIHTDFPYGDFVYNDTLGSKLFGLTPWTVAFAYPPILLLTYWFARKRHTNRWQICFSTAFDAMIIDVVLDPAAVTLGFWHWEGGGFYYGVPLVNFLGWLLSGFVGAVILHRLWARKGLHPALAYSGLLIVWFWTFVNIFLSQFIPAVIGIILFYFFAKQLRPKLQ